MSSQANADDLMHCLLEEIGKVEKLQEVAEKEAGAGGPANAHCDGASFVHVRDGSDLNPYFAKGVDFARLEADRKLESLNPHEFIFLRELEKDEVIAARDSRKKSTLSPGENVASRISGGTERYHAKIRGHVIVIGNLFHILPSDVNGRLAARTDAENLSAFLDIHPAAGRGKMPDLQAVKEYLEKKNIRYGIREATIVEALNACAESRLAVLAVPVSKGFAPVAGKAGSIEYFFDRDFQGPVHLDLDEKGKVDYRKVEWIPVVTEDQLLARVTPAVPGVDGMDVSGRVLPAKAVPRSYLVPGRNVRAENSDTEFYSEINGCVQLNGSLLDVMNVFVVNSDVDYHTGNVRFDGNIMITGSVRKGFEVEAEGDILILGNAEPSRIKAGRDIHVKGGVLGAGKGRFGLEAGREVTAGYTENAWVEAQGDILIENFSLQSFLYSSGRILLEKKRGSIIGGEALAAKSLEAKALGSTAGIKTCVAAGVDYALKRRQVSLKRQEADLKEAMIKIDRFLRSLLELASRGALEPSKAQMLKDIAVRRKQILKASAAITIRRQELEYQQEHLEPGRIKAIEVAHPEVYITVRGRSIKVVETHYRSLFRLDEKTDLIVRGPA